MEKCLSKKELEIDIVASSSRGNCIIIDKKIMVDIGVGIGKVENKLNDLEAILLTHEHKDHINIKTLKKVILLKPNVKVLTPYYMLDLLLKNGIGTNNIVSIDMGLNKFPHMQIIAIKTEHYNTDYSLCDNFAYKIKWRGKKIFFATDLRSYDNLSAKDYDYLLIAANYCEIKIEELINNLEWGEYNRFNRTRLAHPSKQQANKFIVNNAGDHTIIYLLHQSGTTL